MDQIRRGILAFLLFTSQPVVQTVEHSAPRAWRRHSPSGNSHPFVNVVKLRSKQYLRAADGEEHPSRDVDWACRWVVRAHWRNQYYPSLHKHKPLLIPAHMKGPEDKPLKQSINLFDVSR
jgi:hypothetical protein